MSLKLRALGLGLIAAAAMSAVAIMTTINAATTTTAVAKTGGHFVTDDPSGHTILKGEDKLANTPIFLDHHNKEAKVFCKKDLKYHGTITAQTVTELTLTPTISTEDECVAEITIGGGKQTFTAHIDMNGCDFVFTIGETFNEHNTTHLKCPAGNDVRVTVTGLFGSTCTITIKPQTPAIGTALHKGTDERELTLKPTLEGIHAEYLGGELACGAPNGTTTTKGTLNARISVKAFDTAGKQWSIKATGSKD